MYQEFFYSNLESFMLPVYGPQFTPKKSSTQTIDIYQACGYALTVVEFGSAKF